MNVGVILVQIWCNTLCDDNINNQYYRFFTAGLTHTNVLHLIANVCTMLWIGHLYESRLGSVKFLLIGFICAVVSQVIYLMIYPDSTDSFGGSGYNFALCGFCLAMQFLVTDFPRLKWGTWSGNWIITYLIIGNLPILPFMDLTTGVFHIIAFFLGVSVALVCRIFARKGSGA